MTPQEEPPLVEALAGFNTASGMRSHVTPEETQDDGGYIRGFQYRKRYEVTCDNRTAGKKSNKFHRFQYRKRYEVTCDSRKRLALLFRRVSFNTASGMRSHVTEPSFPVRFISSMFQYRKRYEVTCDYQENLLMVE